MTERESLQKRILAVTADPGLAIRLAAFERYPELRGERVLRTLGAKTLALTHDIDRGDYSVGEGLALKTYEQRLGRLAASKALGLMPSIGLSQFREGMVLRLTLDTSKVPADIIADTPLFESGEPVEVGYFIPRLRAVGNEIRQNLADREFFNAAGTTLKRAIETNQAHVLRPRVVDVTNHTTPGWPDELTPLRPRVQPPALG